jgi:hypothetical protein
MVAGEDGAAAAFAEWKAAAAALRALLGGERAAWVPRVAEPQHASTLAEAPRPQASILLVHASPLAPAALLEARQLAAHKPVRGALFSHLGGGRAHERVADLGAPLDPRYREAAWVSGELPARLEDLPGAADADTREGPLTTPLSHLLSMMAPGLEECHYPRARAAGPRAARG